MNGFPGSGKTTLARAISAELRLTLYSKDVVKETLFDWIGTADVAWSQCLGAASMEAIWSLLADCHGDAVVESWMPPQARELVGAGLARAGVTAPLEIWCEVPLDEACRRFAERAPLRHRGHVEHQVVAEYRQRWTEDMGPLGLGRVLRVRTDAPMDLPAVTAWIGSQWSTQDLQGDVDGPDQPDRAVVSR